MNNSLTNYYDPTLKWTLFLNGRYISRIHIVKDTAIILLYLLNPWRSETHHPTRGTQNHIHNSGFS